MLFSSNIQWLSGYFPESDTVVSSNLTSSSSTLGLLTPTKVEKKYFWAPKLYQHNDGVFFLFHSLSLS